jgi:hypothetical protein
VAEKSANLKFRDGKKSRKNSLKPLKNGIFEYKN